MEIAGLCLPLKPQKETCSLVQGVMKSTKWPIRDT